MPQVKPNSTDLEAQYRILANSAAELTSRLTRIQSKLIEQVSESPHPIEALVPTGQHRLRKTQILLGTFTNS